MIYNLNKITISTNENLLKTLLNFKIYIELDLAY